MGSARRTWARGFAVVLGLPERVRAMIIECLRDGNKKDRMMMTRTDGW